MTFKSKQLADLMSDYFEAAWRGATALKDFSGIEWGMLRDIAEKLGSNLLDNVRPQNYDRRDSP
jgi:hypothetical protein